MIRLSREALTAVILTLIPLMSSAQTVRVSELEEQKAGMGERFAEAPRTGGLARERPIVDARVSDARSAPSLARAAVTPSSTPTKVPSPEKEAAPGASLTGRVVSGALIGAGVGVTAYLILFAPPAMAVVLSAAAIGGLAALLTMP